MTALMIVSRDAPLTASSFVRWHRWLKPGNPPRTAQQIFHHPRRNAQGFGDLALILRQSGKDRCFALAPDFWQPLRIDHHGESDFDEVSAQRDRTVIIRA